VLVSLKSPEEGQFDSTADTGSSGVLSLSIQATHLVSPFGRNVSGGTSTDDSYGIAVDGANYPVITGFFSGSANLGLSTLTSAGAAVTKYQGRLARGATQYMTVAPTQEPNALAMTIKETP